MPNWHALYPPHQENHITCGACGTTTLTSSHANHTPTNNSGDIILVVMTHAPQSFVVPQVYHNFIMEPQIQILNHLFTAP